MLAPRNVQIIDACSRPQLNYPKLPSVLAYSAACIPPYLAFYLETYATAVSRSFSSSLVVAAIFSWEKLSMLRP